MKMKYYDYENNNITFKEFLLLRTRDIKKHGHAMMKLLDNKVYMVDPTDITIVK